MRIMSIVGARPNFMKVAAISRAIEDHNAAGGACPIEHTIVHTGQHYDKRMSALFFEELEIPKPHINLGVGSLSHAVQTAQIMEGFEPVLLRERPDVMLVVGDVNSTVACALVASKVEYNGSGKGRRPCIGHVEAGLRSFDRSMPEEINRTLTDALSDLLFTTEEDAMVNLEREGIPRGKVYFVGNVMIDTLLRHLEMAKRSDILRQLGLRSVAAHGSCSTKDDYCVLTLHRPSNVDDEETFRGILDALIGISKQVPILFPCHPRTRANIHRFGLEDYFNFNGSDQHSKVEKRRILSLEPLGYIDFLALLSDAKLVFTDSGGLQEETTALGIPCITLRENTERPVTISDGTNHLVGTKREKIIETALSLLNGRGRRGSVPPLWDGKAGRRILDILIQNVK